ncbi:hypothetical protein [Granulicella sp. dw_53]|uniref:hypothetical protein n=1 Tax=Granulicella sp. dw_53 TaxID=2719792 RepID=UPI001BD4A2C9|nr:hypothetical protein [Granulicella sp. dw_53]
MKVDSLSLSTNQVSTNAQNNPRLKDAAQQFEAILLKEMLKPLQSSQHSMDDDGDDSDKPADVLGEYGTEAIANAISKSGGLGIGKKVLQQVQLESTRFQKN